MGTVTEDRLVAFELRADVQDFAGGTVSVGNGETIDLAAELGSNGRITVAEDSPAVVALDGVPLLKRAKAPRGGKPSLEVAVDVSSMADPAERQDAPVEAVENSENTPDPEPSGSQES